MKLEIEIISGEVISPSSPTPHHLNKYILSSIDQALLHVLVPHVLFYPANNNNGNNLNHISSNSQRSNHLKTSLSHTLTIFYPLAGRLVGNSYVNCNDEGVTYIEAQANYNCKLLDVMESDPNPEELNKFVPNCSDPNDICMVVQATFFCCGGLAIGVGISHKIADALSYFMVLNRWAATSRGDDHNNIQSPIFEAAALFPPGTDLVPVALEKKEHNLVRKRFVFTAQKIADLRDKYTSKDVRPTRVEALSTFILRRFMVATKAKDDASKVYVLEFPVDIRTRMVPSVSEYHFGNLILRAITTVPISLNGDGDGEDVIGYGIVKKISDTIRNLDGDYIMENINEWNTAPLDIITKKQPLSEGVDVVMFSFSSLCRLPLYKADFGWGIPASVVLGETDPRSNEVHFAPTLCTDEIEAWVNLKEEDMIKFEADEKLIDYVSCGDR